MKTTVKGILKNFLGIIKKYGYVLLGNRIYYEGRSQPPLLTQMMSIYYTYTKDKKFITDNIYVGISKPIIFMNNEIIFIIITIKNSSLRTRDFTKQII